MAGRAQSALREDRQTSLSWAEASWALLRQKALIQNLVTSLFSCNIHRCRSLTAWLCLHDTGCMYGSLKSCFGTQKSISCHVQVTHSLITLVCASGCQRWKRRRGLSTSVADLRAGTTVCRPWGACRQVLQQAGKHRQTHTLCSSWIPGALPAALNVDLSESCPSSLQQQPSLLVLI